MDAQALAGLRAIVHDCLAKHMYEAAAFFADKLVTLSGSAPAEVYTLAQAFFCNRQHRRCLQLLRSAELIERDLRFRYLAARCLSECKEWEECLQMLGGLDADTPEQLGLAPPPRAPQGGISYLSAVCLLRGRVYDALDNLPRAARWYRFALQIDPFNYEAFQALVGGQKLSNREELELVEALEVPPQHGWLKLLYRGRCKQYEQSAELELTLGALENESPNRQQQGNGGGGMGGGGAAKGAATPPPAAGRGAAPMLLSPVQEEPGSGASSALEAAAAAAGGWGLQENLDVVTCRAEWLLHRGDYAECYALTAAALEREPYALQCLPAHLAAGVELRKKNELFLRAHRLAEEHPDRAVAWYAVGCYYLATGQPEAARRYFAKATALDRSFAPAWVAFGHAFAAQDESDQAMAAYRTAARLFPGLHAPLLGMGMEYGRMNNAALAEQCFSQAHRLCPRDPLVLNELGVLAYRSRQYAAAEAWLRLALEAAPSGRPATAWEPTLVNLGHALRKLRRWEDAAQCYSRALGLAPGQPGTLAALGYTSHLMGDLDAAIENYHKALGLRPEDVFTAEMLAEAMEEASVGFLLGLQQAEGQPT